MRRGGGGRDGLSGCLPGAWGALRVGGGLVPCSGLGEPTENIRGGAERKSVAGLHQQQAAVQAYVCSCVTHIFG